MCVRARAESNRNVVYGSCYSIFDIFRRCVIIKIEFAAENGMESKLSSCVLTSFNLVLCVTLGAGMGRRLSSGATNIDCV